jgi:hypothetical protein
MPNPYTRAQHEDVTRQLNGLYLAFRDGGTDPPQHLFHYTSAEGLLGIATRELLWASHADFLNDSSEPSYAMKIIEASFQEVVRNLSPRSIAARALNWEDLENGYGRDAPYVYVFCFSEHEDLLSLSQWRGYGGQCAGYALGFSGPRLREYEKDKGRYDGLYLMKVVYKEQDQKEEAQDVFMKLVSTVGGAESAGGLARNREALSFEAETIKKLQSSLSAEVIRLRAKFKAPAFEEEDEWRLVQFLHPAMSQPNICFRPGAKALTPYLELNLGKPPIEQVTIGPTLDPALSRQSLDLLFSKRKFPNVGIKISAVPYRQ